MILILRNLLYGCYGIEGNSIIYYVSRNMKEIIALFYLMLTMMLWLLLLGSEIYKKGNVKMS